MMKTLVVTMRYVFPGVMNNDHPIPMSALVRGRNDSFAFMCLDDSETETMLSFFHFCVADNTFVSRQERWESLSRSWFINVYYDIRYANWLFGHAYQRTSVDKAHPVTGSDGMTAYPGRTHTYLALSHLHWDGPSPLELLACDIDVTEPHAPAYIIGVGRMNQDHQIFYAADCADEVSDLRLYWSIWKEHHSQEQTQAFSQPTALSRHQLQPVGYCDVAVGYRFDHDKRSRDNQQFIFVCQRSFDQETISYPRRGSGSWNFALMIYTPEHELKTQPFTIQGPPIHDVNNPRSDLVFTYEICMEVATGPFVSGQQPTCIAALCLSHLQSSQALINGDVEACESNPEYVGGLYWFNQEGQCLQTSNYRVGTQVCMCSCGEYIVGTDFVNGQRRLWSWRPNQSSDVRAYQELDAAVERATVLAYEGAIPEQADMFWLIEEYEFGVKVTIRSAHTDVEYASEWLYDVLLPSQPWLPLLKHQCKPAGIFTYHKSLYLSGFFNDQNNLSLFEVSLTM